LAWGCATAVDGDAAGLRWTFLQTLTVTDLSLKIAQNEQKLRKSKKRKVVISDGWQMDLAGSCVRYRHGDFCFPLLAVDSAR